MRVAILGATLALMGCVTPYQPMGLSGGYADEKLGEGRYFVEAKGNGFTSKSTIFRYVHRRANELCTRDDYTSYRLLDGTEDTSRSSAASTDAYGNTHVSTVSKHENSAIVQCVGLRPRATRTRSGPPSQSARSRHGQGQSRPQRGDQSESDVAASGHAAGANFYCTSATDGTEQGICLRLRNDCVLAQTKMNERVAYTDCEGRERSACFVYDIGNGRITGCHPTEVACRIQRDWVMAQDGGQVFGDCEWRR